MKAKIARLFALCSACLPLNAQTVPATALSLLSPNGGAYYAGETLEITWQRPALDAKTASFSILLLPEGAPWESFPERTFIIAKDIRLDAEADAAPRGMWRWQIPFDIPHGAYRLEVFETQEHVFPTAWDRSGNIIFIAPKPRIRFLSHREPERIRAGSSPEFRFVIESEGTNKVQAFLLKGSELIGQLLGSHNYHGGGGSFTGTIAWELTRYYDATGRHFAPPGEGYRIVVGILTKEGHGHNTDMFTNAFVSFDETAPFAIVGTPPLLSLQRLHGTGTLLMYIVGEPAQEYVVFHSHTLAPARWQEVWSDRTDADGILGGNVNLKGFTVGFFKAEQLTASPK